MQVFSGFCQQENKNNRKKSINNICLIYTNQNKTFDLHNVEEKFSNHICIAAICHLQTSPESVFESEFKV